MSRVRDEYRHRILVVIAVTVLYALCFVAIKAGLELAPPLRFAGLRAFIAGVVLLGVVVIRREPLIPPRQAWPGLLTLAVIASSIVYGAMFLSPGRTGAGIAAVLGNTQALFTVALAALWLEEALTSWKALALTLGLIGATLISYPALAGPDAYGVSGAALALTASAGSAAGNIIVKRLGPVPSLLAVTAWSLTLGSLPLVGISLVVETGESITWNAEFLGLLIFLALPGTALATAMWYWLLQRSDVGQLAMFLFLVPILGLAFAAMVFGERIGSYEGAGIVAIFLGVGVTAWEMRHPAEPRFGVHGIMDRPPGSPGLDEDPASTQTSFTEHAACADTTAKQVNGPVLSEK